MTTQNPLRYFDTWSPLEGGHVNAKRMSLDFQTALNLDPSFDPKIAFSRSLGWLTEQDQTILAKTTVGLVGLGGVGGQYAEVLARLGVGRFVICDFDTYSIENTNRQNGAKVSNYGRNKCEVITELIHDINPTAQVKPYTEGLHLEQVDEFCRSIDIYIDSLDFFVIDLRIAIFRKMRELGKPAFTVAPIGTGAALVTFTKDSMSFDDYFGLHLTQDPVLRAHRFMIGLAPTLQQRAYVQDSSRVDFENQKAPSLPMGVISCASVAATLVMKLALKRGEIQAAPWSIHYDPYVGALRKKYVWWGFRNPLQRLKVRLAGFIISRLKKKKS